MKTYVKTLSVSFIIILLTLPVLAEKPDSLIYLPDGSIDSAKLIGPPPEASSPEFETQMAIVMWLQKTRTPEQVEFVDKSLNLNRFALIIGDELFDVDGVVLRQTMAEIIKEVRIHYEPFKSLHDIPRPSVANENVKPTMAEVNSVGSYPSGTLPDLLFTQGF